MEGGRWWWILAVEHKAEVFRCWIFCQLLLRLKSSGRVSADCHPIGHRNIGLAGNRKTSAATLIDQLNCIVKSFVYLLFTCLLCNVVKQGGGRGPREAKGVGSGFRLPPIPVDRPIEFQMVGEIYDAVLETTVTIHLASMDVSSASSDDDVSAIPHSAFINFRLRCSDRSDISQIWLLSTN